ncbi:MAG: hypothetical protein VX498_15560 [Myxococcota bacterium]|nr:hypothetical protein [Myxococcota bacterium]
MSLPVPPSSSPGPPGIAGPTGTCFLAILLLAVGLLFDPAATEAQETGESNTAMLSFEAKRLLLLDSRGQAIGPATLGFEPEDFTLFKEQRFHAVRAGEVRYRLDAEEFLELTRDPALQKRWEQAQARLERRKRGSVALIAIGAGLAATGLVAGSAAFAMNDRSVAPALPFVFSGSAAFLVSGTAVNTVTRQRQRQLNDHDLEDLMDRDEAWRASGNYNDALWRSLKLGEKDANPSASTDDPPSP